MCKVSIIIPVYNPGKYFKRCISSVLNQSLQDIEIIIIDDGSENHSYIKQIITQNHDPRIILLSQSHNGVASARNKGIEVSNGEYIGFVDSDDFIHPDMYKHLYTTAIDTNADIVNGDFYIVNENEAWTKYSVSADALNHPDNMKDIHYRKYTKPEILDVISSANIDRILWFTWKGIYKNAMIQNHNIRFPVELSLGEETPFVLECMLISSLMITTNVKLYYYVQRQGSLTRRKYGEGYFEKLEHLYQAKIRVYERYDYYNYYSDLYRYTVTHTIPMILSNELKSGKNFNKQKQVFKKMRESKMICDAFHAYSPIIISSRLKYLALLLKYRQYSLLAFLCR